MIILVTGASHTGKTVLAQKILEKYHYPYVSLDHLKMGLIRSGNSSLTPYSSYKELTDYLWPIIREMIKTAIENHQHLVIEGCYIPINWSDDFDIKYLKDIKLLCLLMSEDYIKNHFNDIIQYASVIETRTNEVLEISELIKDNEIYKSFCGNVHSHCLYIDQDYLLDSDIEKII